MSLSLVSGKSAFLHDGYIATIENCCAPTAVKHTLFPTLVASLLLGASFNTIFCDGREGSPVAVLGKPRGNVKAAR